MHRCGTQKSHQSFNVSNEAGDADGPLTPRHRDSSVRDVDVGGADGQLTPRHQGSSGRDEDGDADLILRHQGSSVRDEDGDADGQLTSRRRGSITRNKKRTRHFEKKQRRNYHCSPRHFTYHTVYFQYEFWFVTVSFFFFYSSHTVDVISV